jgi:hypothetical protein
LVRGRWTQNICGQKFSTDVETEIMRAKFGTHVALGQAAVVIPWPVEVLRAGSVGMA